VHNKRKNSSFNWSSKTTTINFHLVAFNLDSNLLSQMLKLIKKTEVVRTNKIRKNPNFNYKKKRSILSRKSRENTRLFVYIYLLSSVKENTRLFVYIYLLSSVKLTCSPFYTKETCWKNKMRPKTLMTKTNYSKITKWSYKLSKGFSISTLEKSFIEISNCITLLLIRIWSVKSLILV